MKVLKFGGTSVGSPERIKHVASLVSQAGKQPIVVLSAMSGTTNALVAISECLYQADNAGAEELLCALKGKYSLVVDTLFSENPTRNIALSLLNKSFDLITSYLNKGCDTSIQKEILAQGELMSTALMQLHLESCGKRVATLPALEYMRTLENGEPDMAYICKHLQKLLEQNSDADIYLTQGYICRNSSGEVDNLNRGGSDYTASIVGAAIKAEEIQIWTDIDGMHNNDPRFVNGTKPVAELHFDEAAELAYFGAKILHPLCIYPAKQQNIPVRLLNTLQADAPGTLIHNTRALGGIKAIAAKDDITTINIKSKRSLPEQDFCRKVLQIFDSHHTTIDVMSFIGSSMCVAIENKSQLSSIEASLNDFAIVSENKDMVIIAIVGDWQSEAQSKLSSAMHALHNIPIEMISFGSSEHTLAILVRSTDKIAALQSLSDQLFND